jgi:hypothetical protein
MTFPRFQKTGRGVRREPGKMNGWEKKYAEVLTKRVHAGEVLWYAFDCIKFRLAPKTFYDTDFLVMLSDLSMEIHEVKGHWEDDARVKIKVAADKFPFRFRAIKLEKGQWIEELFE